MARSLAWQAAFYLAAFLGTVLDECSFSLIDFEVVSGKVSLPLHLLLNALRAGALLLLGLLYDLKGPRACFLASMLLFLGALLPLYCGLGTSMVLPFNSFGRPSFGLLALGTAGSTADERSTMVGRYIFAGMLGSVFFTLTSWKLVITGAYMDYLYLAPLLLGLQLFLSRDAGKAGSAGGALPVPAAAVAPEGLAAACRPLKRPELLAAFLIRLATPAMSAERSHMLGKAAFDARQERFTGLDLHHVISASTLLLLPFTLASGATARRLGPQKLLLVALQLALATDLTALALFWLPLPGPLVRLCLQLSLVASAVATAAVSVVSVTFVLGVVEASERGTASSLLHIGDNGRHLPVSLYLVTEGLYSVGGVSLPLALFSLTSLGLLLLFRRSPLMHLHLKEG